MPSIIRTLIYYGFMFPVAAFAVTKPPLRSGIGGVANNLMEPVTIIANFVGTISIVIGLSFLLASFAKYMQHRKNEMAVPISTVVLLLIMGILLVCIPFAYKLTDAGVPISL